MTFFTICINISSVTRPKHVWTSWARLFLRDHKFLKSHCIYFGEDWLWQPQYEDIRKGSGYYMENYKNDLEGPIIKMLKRLIRIFLRTDNFFKDTQLYGIWRMVWKEINWYHRIYNGTVCPTQNNPNSLVISHVAIIKFHIGFVWDKHHFLSLDNLLHEPLGL